MFHGTSPTTIEAIIKFLKKHPTWTVADLGCGDAKIALTLPAGRVHSFDLVAVNDRVRCLLSLSLARSRSLSLSL